MNGTQAADVAHGTHEQELRIALVMNGGVSLAVWIGGVTQEINRLVRGETVYGRLCEALRVRPRVDIISGTSAGGINGALLALAMSQGKSLDPLRDLWLNRGDILTLLRKPTESDPPSLLDGGYFYKSMVEGFRAVRDQQGPGLRPPAQVPIELTLTTTVLSGEVRDFPDDMGTLIRDISHRGLLQFRRGPDQPDDPFADPDIPYKLAAASRATASFPVAFEPFYLPSADETVKAGGETVPCLKGHTNFNREWKHGRFVVDGGVLDNSPLESTIDGVFRQRAEGEVRRVLAYVVPDPGHIPDPPAHTPDQIPTLTTTALASLVNIPRVESVSDQLRAIAAHNKAVSSQRDTRLLVARSLNWETAGQVAESVFPGYRLRRARNAADYIAAALVDGAARRRDATGKGIALGRRARQRIAEALLAQERPPWLPDSLGQTVDQGEWHWGLFTLENIMSVVLDLLRRGVGLIPAQRGAGPTDTAPGTELWQQLTQTRRRAYDLVAELAQLRHRDQGHWGTRGMALASTLAELEHGGGGTWLPQLLDDETREWIRLFDPALADGDALRPPQAFTAMARAIGQLLLDSAPVLRDALALGIPAREAETYSDLNTLLDFLVPSTASLTLEDALQRLLTLQVVHYAFGGDTPRDQYLELIQFSANAPTAFGGPDRLEQKLAGVQVAHFGAFYKRSWRINDWMFGRLDGAERLVRILLDPRRLGRLYGWEPGMADSPGAGPDAVLALLRDAVLGGVARPDDEALLQTHWSERLPAMRKELAFLESAGGTPDQLPECAAMVLERLHLDILRQELPNLADAVSDDELDGADPRGNGPKFLKRFRNALFPDAGGPFRRPPKVADAPELPAEQLVQLFKGARIGEERILDELGSDRFTVTATRSAAVIVSALSGKRSGLKLLNVVFATVQSPLIALDILVRALMKKGRAFVALYGMAMAAAATILLSDAMAKAQWPGYVNGGAGVVLVAGLIVLLRRQPKLLLWLAVLVLLIWKGLPLLLKALH